MYTEMFYSIYIQLNIEGLTKGNTKNSCISLVTHNTGSFALFFSRNAKKVAAEDK